MDFALHTKTKVTLSKFHGSANMDIDGMTTYGKLLKKENGAKLAAYHKAGYLSCCFQLVRQNMTNFNQLSILL